MVDGRWREAGEVRWVADGEAGEVRRMADGDVMAGGRRGQAGGGWRMVDGRGQGREVGGGW